MTMATNAEFPPYEYYDKGKIVGVDADMMQAVCDRLGMDQRFRTWILIRSLRQLLPVKQM